MGSLLFCSILSFLRDGRSSPAELINVVHQLYDPPYSWRSPDERELSLYLSLETKRVGLRFDRGDKKKLEVKISKAKLFPATVAETKRTKRKDSRKRSQFDSKHIYAHLFGFSFLLYFLLPSSKNQTFLSTHSRVLLRMRFQMSVNLTFVYLAEYRYEQKKLETVKCLT